MISISFRQLHTCLSSQKKKPSCLHDIYGHTNKNPFMKDTDTNFKLYKSLTISIPLWVTQNSFDLNSQT